MPQKGPADTRRASVTSPKRWRATASGPSATTSLATTPLTSPVPYRMPKRLPFVAYVDERRASKRACARHVGAPHATDGIHRLLEPVSKMTSKRCGGVPTPIVPTYCVFLKLRSSCIRQRRRRRARVLGVHAADGRERRRRRARVLGRGGGKSGREGVVRAGASARASAMAARAMRCVRRTKRYRGGARKVGPITRSRRDSICKRKRYKLASRERTIVPLILDAVPRDAAQPSRIASRSGAPGRATAGTRGEVPRRVHARTRDTRGRECTVTPRGRRDSRLCRSQRAAPHLRRLLTNEAFAADVPADMPMGSMNRGSRGAQCFGRNPPLRKHPRSLRGC